ncbi:MAG: efflux RND transporter permease subunit, partial [Chlamydiota bacterium]|nr:efflux RND transporter permease subunit [Chlamydiota bacterium]
MGFPSYSVRRPVSILMLYVGLVLFGIVSLTRLPVELMPNASYNKITILINIRGGMPPEDVEFMVTKPIEEAISSVSNMDSIGSTSKEGKATIVLSFQPGLDMDFAALEVREKFSKVKNKLPRSAEKPVIAKYEESDVPVMILAVTGLNHTIEQVRTIVEERIKERLARIHGVANIEIGGGRERKIICEVDQRRAQATGLSLQRIVSSISQNNLNLMVGNVDKKNYRFLIRTVGQYPSIDSIRNIHVLKTEENSLIRLKDIADVKDSFLEAQTHSRTNTKDVVSLYIQKESTGNTVTVCEGIQSEIDSIVKTMEKDIRVITVSNQAIFIKEAIETVQNTLVQGAILAIIVLFLFLRDIRSTLTIGLSIPLSVVITFSLMYFSNLTINVQSLSGLALGIGMLVDNSIVVLENIFVKKNQGLNSIDAAIEGSEEMLLAIVTSTATTILIFIPIIFFTNEQMKILYGPIAFTVTFSLLSSLLVALSIVPMLNSRGKDVIKAVAPKKKKETKGIMLGFQHFYRKLLLYVVRYRYVVVPITFFILYLSGSRIMNMDKELLASSEQGKFTIFVELPSGAKLELSDLVVKEVEDMLETVPEIKTFSSRVEGWSSKVYVDLVPPEQRDKEVEDIIEELRPKVKTMGEAERAFIYFSESRGGGSREILIDVYGYDYKVLKKLATEIAGKMEGKEGFTDLKLRMKEGRPEMLLVVDKQDAANNDLTTKEIADEL